MHSADRICGGDDFRGSRIELVALSRSGYRVYSGRNSRAADILLCDERGGRKIPRLLFSVQRIFSRQHKGHKGHSAQQRGRDEKARRFGKIGRSFGLYPRAQIQDCKRYGGDGIYRIVYDSHRGWRGGRFGCRGRNIGRQGDHRRSRDIRKLRTRHRDIRASGKSYADFRERRQGPKTAERKACRRKHRKRRKLRVRRPRSKRSQLFLRKG